MPSRPGFWPTAALVAASFLLVFEFLAYQLRHGEDPALGSTSASPTRPPRPVVLRRVIDTRVVEDPSADSSGAAVSSGVTSGPTTSPATSAPAPAPAAPVVTSSS